MVALKHFFLLGISLASAIPWSVPAAKGASSIEARDPSDQVSQGSDHIAASSLEKRVPGRATLQWTNSGVFFFNLGLSLPDTVTKLLINSADIAQQLSHDFLDFAFHHPNAPDLPMLPLAASNVGGLYSKEVHGAASFGVGIALNPGATAQNMDDIRATFIKWMALQGGTVQVIERAAGTLDPTAIGYVPYVSNKDRRDISGELSRRTREDLCPSDGMNLVQYAQNVDPVVDDLRWIGPHC